MASDSLKIPPWQFRGAVEYGDADIVRQGLAQNPEWSKKVWSAKSGSTALHLAAGSGCLGCVNELLSTSDANAVDQNGATALMVAAGNWHWDCVKTLLASTDTRIQNNAGLNALMAATMGANVDMVRDLAPRSDLGIFSGSGETALDMALGHEHWDCADILAAGMSLADIDNALILAPESEPMPMCRAQREAEELQAAIGGEGGSENPGEPVGEREGAPVAHTTRRV